MMSEVQDCGKINSVLKERGITQMCFIVINEM